MIGNTPEVQKVLVVLQGKGRSFKSKIDNILLNNGLLLTEDDDDDGIMDIMEYDAKYMTPTWKELDAEVSKITGVQTNYNERTKTDEWDPNSLYHMQTLEISAR